MDYSEFAGILSGNYDFYLIKFPESPPYRAYSITVAERGIHSFAGNLINDQMDSTNQKEMQSPSAIRENLMLILHENVSLAEKINYDGFSELIRQIRQADTVFLIATGRSGFAMRSIAMRLMHLGLKAFFAGETTTPAIKAGDLLWASSGSGSTGGILRAAGKAKQAGATVITMTTNPGSALAVIADTHVLIPAAEKQDHTESKSSQYAGSLFEQFLLLIGDAVFMQLWKIEGSPAEELWKRHANME